MNTYYFIGDSLKKTRWENLTFDEYYTMSGEKRQELKEYLESINAPSGYELLMEEEDELLEEEDELSGVCFISWRDIVLMSDEDLDFYKAYWDARVSNPPMPEVVSYNYDDIPF